MRPPQNYLACEASVSVVLDAREMGRERKNGGGCRGEEASSPPTPLMRNRLFSAENSTETLENY